METKSLETIHKRIKQLEDFLRKNQNISEDQKDLIEEKIEDLNDLFISTHNSLNSTQK
jgi:hypothetical protein